ncbi:hypothetical protein G6F71_008639 [Rhizopus microsporus]|nr:hypothetical protein G6F71_008639 [Rhizopus microsporus]
MLLYRFERHQYAEILRQHPNTEPVDVYGAEHLLRLFVQMPSLIAHTTMDTDAVQVLTDYLSDILRFMQKQQKQLFQAEYENAAPGYVALSEIRYPLRAVWDVKGYPTETLLWPAKNNTNKTVLFFIPGNPGLVEYYAPFLDNIYQNLQSPLLEIIGVSHKGHSVNYHADTARDKTLYSFEDQIQHKIDCLDTLIKENGPETKFILIAHSIGSYIAAEMLKKRPNHGISRIIALFPALQNIAVTPNGVVISKVINWTPISAVGAAGSLISWLAPPVREFLVKTITRQSGNGLNVTAHQLLHSSVLMNTITMARYEMETVKDLDHDFYQQHLEKFVIYYSENDKWAPKEHYDYMIKHFPKGDIHLCKLSLPHAFCLEPDHVDYMAKLAASWIQTSLVE